MQCLTYGSSCTEIKEISQASSNNWTNKLPTMVVIYALIETIKQTVNVITDSHADQNPISAPISIAISIDNKINNYYWHLPKRHSCIDHSCNDTCYLFLLRV